MSRGNEGLPAFNSEDELDYLSGVWVSGIGRPAFGLFGSKHIAPLEQGEATVLSTNILPRWGRRIWASGFYKHAAPLGQADLGLRLLQTCCPAGAGGSGLRASTNMLPRWGRGTEDSGFYKHAAPLGKTVISGSSGPKPKAGTQRRGYHLLERYSLKH